MGNGGEAERAREIIREAREGRPSEGGGSGSRRPGSRTRLAVLLGVAAVLLVVMLLDREAPEAGEAYSGPGDRVVAAALLEELEAFRDSTGRYPASLDEIGASGLPDLDYAADGEEYTLAVGDSLVLDQSTDPGMVALPPGLPGPDGPPRNGPTGQ
jgi:hypothetical protein